MRGSSDAWAEALLGCSAGLIACLLPCVPVPFVLPLQVDVRDRPAVEKAVARAAEELGGLRIMVANAGEGRRQLLLL